ncbi:HAD hydrolase-like protein [Candidatus Babeliales bacterium]|nr:HAD hydrolase-like protein [Candidatus Babeliales bacterium]MBP9843770.1 HAD hydrolase-like protein [Candidatus Babeliales bacterium]
MNYKHKTLAFLFFFTTCSNDLSATFIKHIFVDINALVATSPTAASKIVGIINSMKYTARVGHIPSKSDFFKALKNVPAQSSQLTYNDDLVMPAILSDWLLGLQSNNTIRYIINQYLEKCSISEIEKTIFKNISSMMMNPAIFIDTQYLMKDIAKILHTLKKSGYNIYIIGNWDKESEQFLMKLLHGHFLPEARHCYFSSKAKQLKPHSEYFELLVEHFNVNIEESLIIDVEKNHVQAARHQGFSTILLHGHNPTQLKSELSRIGIKI